MRHRKVEEALLLCAKLRRYCPDAADSRIVLLSGLQRFTPVQVEFLTAELGPDFHVVAIDEEARLRELLDNALKPSDNATS